MRHFPQFCGIEQEGEWFEVYFYDRVTDGVAVPVMISVPMCRLKEHFEAQNTNEHNYGYYEHEIRPNSFEDIVNDLHCREERDRYLKDIVRDIVADKEKEKQHARDIQRLSQAYNELLEKFRVLENELEKGKDEAPIISIQEALFAISQAHIKNLKEAEEDKHAREIYQSHICTPFPLQANG